jgi:hypothetical protein
MSKTYLKTATTSSTSVTNQFYNLYNRIPLCITCIGGFVSDSRDGVDYTAIQSRCMQAFSVKTSNHCDGSFPHSTTEKRMCLDLHPGAISKYHGTRLPVRHIATPSGQDATMTADWPPIVSEMRHGDDNSCHDLAHAFNQSFSHSVIS